MKLGAVQNCEIDGPKFFLGPTYGPNKYFGPSRWINGEMMEILYLLLFKKL
jgi:hypothetical protein